MLKFTDQKNDSCDACTHGKICVHRNDYQQFIESISSIQSNAKGPFNTATTCAHYEEKRPSSRDLYIKEKTDETSRLLP